MSSTRVVFAAAMAGCLTMTAVQATAGETGVALGAVLRLPFVGGLAADKKSEPRFGLGMSMRQESLVGLQRFDRRSIKMDIFSLPFSGSGVDLYRARFMGRELYETRTILGADSSGESGAATSSKTLLYGVVGLAVVGGIVLAATSGSNDPDACIAIFPPPPGCP